jgi:RNA polymerase sigma factor (TIGR02999 family)
MHGTVVVEEERAPVEHAPPEPAEAKSDEAPAADRMFAVLYDDLHRMARRHLARGARDMTLGTTTLLHEAYLDMAGRERAFEDRGRFMAYAGRVMRALVIDHVRNRRAQKRGSQFELTSLDVDVADPAAAADELVRIGRLVDELAEVEPRQAQVVDLRFFCGFTFVEIAAMWGLSERSIQRQWQRARLYLYDAMRNGEPAAR